MKKDIGGTPHTMMEPQANVCRWEPKTMAILIGSGVDRKRENTSITQEVLQ